jgi:tetratricopeptide (TPR) repeat protein
MQAQWADEIDHILDRRLDAEIMHLADAGNFDEAEKRIPQIRSEESRTHSVGRVVNAHIFRREYDAALALIPRLTPYDQVMFLESLTRSLERSRPIDAHTAGEAMLKAFAETSASIKYNGLASIVAGYLVRRGREEEARDLLREGLEAAPLRAGLIASDQIRFGFVTDALASIDRLDTPNQILRLARGAEVLASSGQLDTAKDFLTRARTLALSDDHNNRALNLETIDQAQEEVNRTTH